MREAIAPQQTNNIKSAIAPNLSQKRSPKTSTLSPHKRSPFNKPTTPNSDRPNLIQKAIASNIHTFTT